MLAVNPRGFGFVTSAGREDVYVAADGIGGALHGDRVVVGVVSRSNRGAEGRIERIVTRRSPRVAGVLRRRRASSWLEPDDSRLRGPIVLLRGPSIGNDGDAAVATITRFPDRAEESPEGELVAVLGVPGDPNVEVAKILVREQIVEEHPEAALREAEAMAARIQKLPLDARTDLRHVPLPSIDPEDARDHDDAVWVERRGDGYRAYIAIADVSEYVEEGSELDREALARGCTIYLPDRAIPMLPAALSAELCSLLPDHDRLCLCVIAELDAEARVKKFDLVEGVMRSAAMLTYGGVARALGYTDAPAKSTQAEAMKPGLCVVAELSKKLRVARMRRGALDLDLPEAKVELDEKTGRPLAVRRRAEDPGVKQAYQIIEELMLLANELVAAWLARRRSPTVYRIHAQPDPEKLERFGKAAETLGVLADLDELMDSKGFSRFIASLQKHPKKRVLESLLLRSLKQASYDVNNIGHFGLASSAYLHFTSPIRRHPDVQVHRAVKRLLRGGEPDASPAALELLRSSATIASVRERAAMEIEREVVDLYRALYMREHLGDTLEGTVVAVVGGGVFVTLDDPFCDVLVRWEGMGPDRYEATEDGLGAVGASSGDRVRLGDRMLVSIEDVALLRRTVYARRIPPEGAFDGKAPGGKGGRRDERPRSGREQGGDRGRGGGGRHKGRFGGHKR